MRGILTKLSHKHEGLPCMKYDLFMEFLKK